MVIIGRKPANSQIIFVGAVFLMILIGLLIVWVAVPVPFGWNPEIDLTNLPSNSTQIIGTPPANVSYVIVNGTLFLAKISIQTVPTIINGISTATSLIIGFTGTAIGLMYKELFRNDKKMKSALISLIFVIGSSSFFYFFLVYTFLINGLLVIALRTSMIGFLLTLLLFFEVLLLAFFRLAKKSETVGKLVMTWDFCTET